MKVCHPSARAEADVDAAVEWYLAQRPELALEFVQAYSDALDPIGAHPATGSRRHGIHAGRAELRCWLLDRFPYGVFYLERADHIEVLRVLHRSSDIPTHLETN